MIVRPGTMGAFEFVVVSALRAKQLARGCVPLVSGGRKASVTARIEVSEGKISALATSPAATREADRPNW